MPALRKLVLNGWEAHAVLMPGDPGKPPVQGVRVTVTGDYFPIRAVEPEVLVGEAGASRVQIGLDQRRIFGFFTRKPPEGGVVRVRYGDSQEGELEQRFRSRSVKPLPKECG